MSEEQNSTPEHEAAAAAGQAPVAQMAVHHVFLKDCSFEAPGALGMDKADGQPDMNLNLAQRVNPMDEQRVEVVLTVTVTAKQGERTAFIAEVQYSGVFQFAGFNDQQMPYVVNVMCPNVLFPYARNQIAQLIAAGGFLAPPLQPINFETIYAQRVADSREGQPTDDGVTPGS
ncbi:MAG: protein-export chaperone SecB [Pseudomonadota bacterium]